MDKYLYLLIDFSCILLPFLFSFHPKIKFYTQWKWFIPANLIVAFLFLIWDEYFTRIGVWGFNPKYILGVYVMNIPLEEILFFICIPYACAFTYYVIKSLNTKTFLDRYIKKIHYTFIISCIVFLIIGYPKLYPTYTMIFCIAIGITMFFNFKYNLSYFYIMYGAILLPFFISNGLLTGSFIPEEVVWYNNLENLSLRVFTIPVEDFYYGFLLLSLNICIYEKFKFLFPPSF